MNILQNLFKIFLRILRYGILPPLQGSLLKMDIFLFYCHFIKTIFLTLLNVLLGFETLVASSR